jgi:hypothetical protein
MSLDDDDVEQTARSRVLAQMMERGKALRDACMALEASRNARDTSTRGTI